MPMQPNSMNGMNALPMMRPPSRAGSSMGMHPPNGMNMSMDFSQPHMNGARPSQPGFPASMHAPTPSQGSPPLGSPVSGSPFHQNSHSKVPGSPRPSSTAPIAPIPGLPLNAAALHAGMSLGTEQSISVGLNQQRNTASPRPPSSAGMHPAPSPAFPLSAGEPPQFTMPPAPPSPSPSLSSAPLPNVDSPQRGPSEVPDTKSVSSPARDPDPSVSPSLTRSMPAEPGPSTSSAAPPAAIPKLKPLPSDVQLEKAVTQIEVVPLAKSDITIPPLKDDEIKNMQGWMEKDREYTKIFKASQDRIRREDIQSVKSGMWWERVGDPVLGLPDIPHRARETWKTTFPREVIQPKRKGKRLGFNLPRTVDKVLVERPELLVPIRLEFDVDLQRMRETFLWNINDPIITPEIFAQSLVDDYTLNASYHSVITKSIQEQLSDYEMHNSEPSSSQSTDGPKSGNLEEQDAEWWERWRKRQKTPSAFAKSGVKTHNGRKAKKRRKVVLDDTEDAVTDGDDEYRPMTLDDATMQVDEDEVREDLRILVKLDIIVGRMRLDDQFEWDLENLDASPEGFAEVYCQELGLGGEFKTAIAHSIREQVFAYRKSLFLIGHPTDGQPIQDEDMRSSFLPPLANGARPMDQVPAYTPILAILDDSELDRNEKDGEKDINKRRKRNQRARRGVALPDREPIRTFRTPANGFPEIDPSKLQPVNTLPVRRAAAAAAQANIANIASLESREEGDVSPTQISRPLPSVSSATTATPVAPQPTPVTKEKKTKGLIEGPKIPPELLRPRAQVPAPTPSTAVDPSTLGEPLEGDAPPTPPPVIVELPRPKPVYKKPKDLAREAKEKEWADGQHENMIDGVWHCSNCGCPEALAVGRRQGPLGNGSQCGPCGKFWHGHKRPKSIEWNPSYEHHLKLQQESVSPSKRRRKPQAPKAHSQPVVVPPPSNGKSSTRDEQSYDDRAISPVSSTSSTSEQPLSQRVKMNGHAKDDSATPSRPSSTVDAQGSAAPRSSGTPTPSDSITVCFFRFYFLTQ
ncbi:hypothetical protein DL96DRAFT_1596763 [Flagelloscypha sp. PMI_526]|nr:hypothetical protein DL96DRAFT_1596763 [Flagelloscypha sp. PMI_526]